jgi:hypothetical protein
MANQSFVWVDFSLVGNVTAVTTPIDFHHHPPQLETRYRIGSAHLLEGWNVRFGSEADICSAKNHMQMRISRTIFDGVFF